MRSTTARRPMPAPGSSCRASPASRFTKAVSRAVSRPLPWSSIICVASRVSSTPSGCSAAPFPPAVSGTASVGKLFNAGSTCPQVDRHALREGPDGTCCRGTRWLQLCIPCVHCAVWSAAGSPAGRGLQRLRFVIQQGGQGSRQQDVEEGFVQRAAVDRQRLSLRPARCFAMHDVQGRRACNGALPHLQAHSCVHTMRLQNRPCRSGCCFRGFWE